MEDDRIISILTWNQVFLGVFILIKATIVVWTIKNMHRRLLADINILVAAIIDHRTTVNSKLNAIDKKTEEIKEDSPDITADRVVQKLDGDSGLRPKPNYPPQSEQPTK